MDADYINEHLLTLAKLFYGKNSKCYSKSKGDTFVFGSKKLKVKNTITKPVAIYLAVGQIKIK